MTAMAHPGSNRKTSSDIVDVLFIAHGFPPVQHSGVFRSEAFAKYLPQNRIRLFVVCAKEAKKYNVTYNAVDRNRFDDESEALVRRIDWDANTCAEVSGFFGKLAAVLPIGSAMESIEKRNQKAAYIKNRILEEIQGRNIDAIYASSPPSEALIVAQHLSELLEVPYICDLRDPWSMGWTARYRSYFDFMIERSFERKVLAGAAAVIANTEQAKRQLVNAIGISEDKVSVLSNGFDEELFARSDARPPELQQDKFNIVYTGVYNSSSRNSVRSWKDAIKSVLFLDYCPMKYDETTRSPRYVLEAARRLFERRPALKEKIAFHFVGGGGDFSDDSGLDVIPNECLLRHGAISHEDSVNMCRHADALLLLQVEMRDSSGHGVTAIPAKTYTYLRTGKPIIAPMQEGEATALIRDCNAGIVVGPRDVDGIQNALETLVDSKSGDRPCPATLAPKIGSYDRRAIAVRLAEIIREVVRR